MTSGVRHLWKRWAGATVAILLLLACASPDPVLDVGHSRQVGRVLAQMQLVHQTMIRAASLAPARAQSKAVRDYAERIEMDHGFAARRVRGMAERFDIHLEAEVEQLQHLMMQSEGAAQDEQTAEERQQLRETREIMLEVAALEALEGADFDRAFVQLMGNAHPIAVQHFEQARAQTQLVPLEDLLSRTIPLLDQHIALAEVLR